MYEKLSLPAHAGLLSCELISTACEQSNWLCSKRAGNWCDLLAQGVKGLFEGRAKTWQTEQHALHVSPVENSLNGDVDINERVSPPHLPVGIFPRFSFDKQKIPAGTKRAFSHAWPEAMQIYCY